MGEQKTVKIKDLIVWTDNPRMANEQITNELEAINILIDEVGLNKMKALAKDVFTNGLNPHRQPIAVINADGTYNVYDGNRRISVIKSVLHGDKRFNRIDNEIGLTVETGINTYVTDIDEALRLIEVEHTGEAEGRGQIPWEAFQRDYAFKQNNKNAIYPYAYEISKICKLNRKSHFKRIPYTDLDTIFSNEIIKNLFSIEEDWDFSNTDFIKDVYARLCNAKTRTPYSRYLPRLKNEIELSSFRSRLFPELEKDSSKEPSKEYTETQGHETKKEGGTSTSTYSYSPAYNAATHKATENKQETTSKNESEDDKQKRNNYKVSPLVLFNWRGKGINIDNAVFKPTLNFAISLQINTGSEMKRISAYLYRVLLEIAFRHWVEWFRYNESKFNVNNIENYSSVKDGIIGTTNESTSFVTENKAKNIISVLKNIKTSVKNSEIRTYFKNRPVSDYGKMINELNEVIHGSKEYIDNSILEKYDTMISDFLIALSVSLND